MEKNIYSTKIITFLFSVLLIGCNTNNKDKEQSVVEKYKLSLTEVENLYYKIKPLQDTIEYISEYRKGEETLYGVSFDEDSLNYNFSIILMDEYIPSVEYKILRKNDMFILLTNERILKDTLVADTLTRYFYKKDKIMFDTLKIKMGEYPFCHFKINKKNLDSVEVDSQYW